MWVSSCSRHGISIYWSVPPSRLENLSFIHWSNTRVPIGIPFRHYRSSGLLPLLLDCLNCLLWFGRRLVGLICGCGRGCVGLRCGCGQRCVGLVGGCHNRSVSSRAKDRSAITLGLAVGLVVDYLYMLTIRLLDFRFKSYWCHSRPPRSTAGRCPRCRP